MLLCLSAIQSHSRDQLSSESRRNCLPVFLSTCICFSQIVLPGHSYATGTSDALRLILLSTDCLQAMCQRFQNFCWKTLWSDRHAYCLSYRCNAPSSKCGLPIQDFHCEWDPPDILLHWTGRCKTKNFVLSVCCPDSSEAYPSLLRMCRWKQICWCHSEWWIRHNKSERRDADPKDTAMHFAFHRTRKTPFHHRANCTTRQQAVKQLSSLLNSFRLRIVQMKLQEFFRCCEDMQARLMLLLCKARIAMLPYPVPTHSIWKGMLPKKAPKDAAIAF